MNGIDLPRNNRGRFLFTKVPEITIYFWIVKLLTTAMGEATSDALVYHINPYIAVGLGALGFVAALVIQFTVKRYNALAYWLLVVMVSIFGTMVADVIHIVLGVPYAVSTCCFVIALVTIFVSWYVTERTLSIHSIYTTRREVFYWAAVLATFALGTASGDLTASTMHLGYFASGILFGVLFAIPGICYWLFDLNPIAAFWLSYILTRPLGASFADWFGKPHSLDGLGYGDLSVSLVLTTFIVVFVAYLAVTRVDVKQETGEADLREEAPGTAEAPTGELEGEAA